MKRFLSIFLCLIIVISIAFQCSFSSSAAFVVDDAVVIGVCLDLLAAGISIYSVSQFVQSDTFHDFCKQFGDDLQYHFSMVKVYGSLFLLTAADQWKKICNWVKSKFSPKVETKEIEFETNTITTPSTLTLSDGTVVPYAGWMEYPFFIYRTSGVIKAIYCTGEDAGITMATRLVQVFCVGGGSVSRYDLISDSWSHAWTENMTYGTEYKGQGGSVYNVSFSSAVDASKPSFYLYRTIPRTNTTGTQLEDAPPQNDPGEVTQGTATVTASCDPVYYPGAVDAPAVDLAEGDFLAIPIPEEMIVDANTSNPTVTTDSAIIASVLGELTPSDVKPKVLTQTATSNITTIDQIITDTPVAEMDSANAGNAQSDIEIANKFRLPKSFLEGFPFSIPYSIFCGIQSFLADPEAPVFNFPFSIPSLGLDENVEIDLSKWNPIARLCRALLSLVWVAGLAMACNKFIKR